MADDNAQNIPAWVWWLGAGIIFLVLVLAASFMFLREVASSLCEEEGNCPDTPDTPADVVVNIANLNMGVSDPNPWILLNLEAPGVEIDDEVTPPIRMEVTHDLRDSKLLKDIHQTLQDLLNRTQEPVKVEVVFPDGCEQEDCPPSPKDSEVLEKIHGTLQELVTGTKQPVKVEIVSQEGCGQGDCPPSIFVQGDLNWSKTQVTELVDGAEGCNLKWIGRVCGFGAESSEWISEQTPDQESEQASQSTKDEELLTDSFQDVVGNLKSVGSGRQLNWMVLLGRSDPLPFGKPQYGGNWGLAPARAREVHKQLRASLGNVGNHAEVLDQRTMLIGTGPLNVPLDDSCISDPDCDARKRDRGVDVFACVLPDASGTGSAGSNGDGEDVCGGPVGWDGKAQESSAPATTPR